jgi:glycerol-3-phosphate acyltransferase PlsX
LIIINSLGDFWLRIALDIMGGDKAPYEIVHGAVEAITRLRYLDCIYLVGDEVLIKKELLKYPKVNQDKLKIVHAGTCFRSSETCYCHCYANP